MNFELMHFRREIQIEKKGYHQSEQDACLDLLRRQVVEDLVEYMRNDVMYTVLISKNIRQGIASYEMGVSETPQEVVKMPELPLKKEYTFRELNVFAWRRIKKIFSKHKK